MRKQGEVVICKVNIFVRKRSLASEPTGLSEKVNKISNKVNKTWWPRSNFLYYDTQEAGMGCRNSWLGGEGEAICTRSPWGFQETALLHQPCPSATTATLDVLLPLLPVEGHHYLNDYCGDIYNWVILQLLLLLLLLVLLQLLLLLLLLLHWKISRFSCSFWQEPTPPLIVYLFAANYTGGSTIRYNRNNWRGSISATFVSSYSTLTVITTTDTATIATTATTTIATA